MQALEALVGELYACVPADFTPARDAAARAATDPALKARIKTLRKPTMAAWAVNLLVRRERDQVAQALAVGESLREAAAALDADQLRALTVQRRQLTQVLAQEAARHAALDGHRLSPATVEQVHDALTAAMIDPLAAQVVRSGAMVTVVKASGWEPADVAEAVALPEALGMVAPSSRRRPSLSVVPEAEPGERLRDEATARLATATQELTIAREVQTSAAEKVAHAEAAVLQVQAQLDELQRRIAELEVQADALDDDLETARRSAQMAEQEVADAEVEQRSAQAALAKLNQSR